MKTASQQELQDVLNRSMQETTSRFAGIQLVEKNVELSNDTCTIYTVLEGEERAVLLLCADIALLTRLARNIMHLEQITQQDIEDVAMEYFNVVCGCVVAGIFQMAHSPLWFQVPNFHFGHYLPQVSVTSQCVLNYDSREGERVQLVYMKLDSPDHIQTA